MHEWLRDRLTFGLTLSATWIGGGGEEMVTIPVVRSGAATMMIEFRVWRFITSRHRGRRRRGECTAGVPPRPRVVGG
jgi:hypothetical protein